MSDIIQLIPDADFSHGFTVHGPRHEDGRVATYRRDAQTAWNIAQWGVYNHPLSADTPCEELPGGGYRYATDTLSVTVHPADGDYDVRLFVDTRPEYGTRPRQGGEDWPHLLVEQSGWAAGAPRLCDMERLHYHCEFRIDGYENHMTEEQFRRDLHTAQVSQFFTVNDVNTGDYMWFGLPYFDHRSDIQSGGSMIDSGKADATGKLIYGMDQHLLTDVSPKALGWLVYDIDLLPHIRGAFDYAKENGLYPHSTWEDMAINHTNFGFEMPGTFSGAMCIRNMSLLAHLK